MGRPNKPPSLPAAQKRTLGALHAAYMAARHQITPEEAEPLAKDYGAETFGGKNADDLRRKLAAECTRARKAIRDQFPEFSAPAVAKFWVRAQELREAALETVDEQMYGKSGSKGREELLAQLRARCPGFGERTYERALNDAYFSLR